MHSVKGAITCVTFLCRLILVPLGLEKGQFAYFRWIYGRGCPTLNASVRFDPKAFTVDVRLQQQGSLACRDSTVRAMNISKDGGIGAIKVSAQILLIFTYKRRQQARDAAKHIL